MSEVLKSYKLILYYLGVFMLMIGCIILFPLLMLIPFSKLVPLPDVNALFFILLNNKSDGDLKILLIVLVVFAIKLPISLLILLIESIGIIKPFIQRYKIPLINNTEYKRLENNNLLKNL